jgi:hypothetical protein
MITFRRSVLWARSAAACAVLASAAFAASAAAQQQSTWDKLPRMELERQFAGPLQDTVIQRWRDPTDGTLCYIYLPISAPHSQPTPNGFVQYGATTIGSISCLAGPPGQHAPAAQPATPRRQTAPAAPVAPAR